MIILRVEKKSILVQFNNLLTKFDFSSLYDHYRDYDTCGEQSKTIL